MRAYLTEGELMSDHDALRRLGVEAGLPGDEVVELLATERFAEEVRDDERAAAALGISAVPFFVVDRAIAASGAQPAELFLRLLRQAAEIARPAIPVVAGGEACGPDGC